MADEGVSGEDSGRRGVGALAVEPLLWVALYLLACSAVFIAFPAIDTAVAGWFHDASGFPATKLASLMALRRLGDQLVILVLVVLAASLVGKLVWPARPMAIRPRSTLYLLASLALGPGLVVNAIFKSWSGRPRPIQTDLFGGDWSFDFYMETKNVALAKGHHKIQRLGVAG